jgi:hypothetical protein
MMNILMLCLVGCSFKNNATHIINEPLNGTFISYHSAMGSGKGIIFRVTIPSSLENIITIDSFYLHEKSYPFTLLKSQNRTLLEANYYLPVLPPSYANNQIQQSVTLGQKITDSIIINHLFYPSWITVSGKSGKQKIEISLYNEIISNYKY